MAADAGAIRAGKAFVEIFADDSKLVQGLRSAQQKLQQWGTRIAAVGAAGVTAMLGMAKSFATVGDEIQKGAIRTGLSAEALSSLAFAAEQSGASLQAVQTGFKGLSNFMLNAERGAKESTDTLRDLGLTLGQLKALGPEERFKLLADRIAGIPDPSQRAALAMKVFGRAGLELVPLLAEGAAGIEKLQREADLLGRTMSTEDANAAAKLNDAIGRVTSAFSGLKNILSAAVAPALTEAANKIASLTAGLTRWVDQNREAVVTTLKWFLGLLALGTGMVVAATAIKLVLGALALYRTAMKGVAAAQAVVLALQGPKGWIQLGASLAIAGAAVYGLSQAFDELVAHAPDLKELNDAIEQAKADQERQQNFAAAADARQQADDHAVEEGKKFVRMMEEGASAGEKLRAKLDELRLARLGFGELVNASDEARAAFRRLADDAINSATGIFDQMAALRKEIALMSGTATESGLAFAEMAEKLAGSGAPPELLAQYKQLLQMRDALKEQQDAAAKIETKKSEAENVRQANLTPEERFAEERDRLFGLARTRDQQGNRMLDDQTLRRALEKARERMEAELKIDGGVQQTRRAGALDVRGTEGFALVAQALGGGRSPEEEIAKNSAQSLQLQRRQEQLDRLIERHLAGLTVTNLGGRS